MQYQQTLDYLYRRLPIFQNQGVSALKEGLSGIIKFCDYLGNPQNTFKTIHIAGTNGKGSTSHMLASIIQESGLKTGLYTSPHLIDFRERIRINGKVISKKYVQEFVKKHFKFIESNSFSFFEVTVAMAFQFFADKKVDIAVIEVGLGGRLDSTNIITPILSIITNISYDHKQILGNTLSEIASEKAGIIKENVPVVISITQKETELIFKEKAKLLNAEIHFADQEYNILNSYLAENKQIFTVQNKYQKELYKLDLLGNYQQFNVLGVIKACEILNYFKLNISQKRIKRGLSKVQKNTGLLGRWQILRNKPLIICDTGHNEAGILEVVKNINLQKFSKLHMVIGFVKDKEIDNILPHLPVKAQYYFCNAKIPRALESNILAQRGTKFNLKGQSFGLVSKAYEKALNEANLDDLIFIGGSTFVVADLLKYLHEMNMIWATANKEKFNPNHDKS